MCLFGFFKCSEKQIYSPADGGGNALGFPRKGTERGFYGPKSLPVHPKKAPGRSPTWLCPTGAERSFCTKALLHTQGRLYLAPNLLPQTPLLLPIPSERCTHMRLLGGILRPSRNQVTCGWGKLAMRGARMTAASPWETLWCFSPSSKLPMSAAGTTAVGSGAGGQPQGLPSSQVGSGGYGWKIWGRQDDHREGGHLARATPFSASPLAPCPKLLSPFISLYPSIGQFVQPP